MDVVNCHDKSLTFAVITIGVCDNERIEELARQIVIFPFQVLKNHQCHKAKKGRSGLIIPKEPYLMQMDKTHTEGFFCLRDERMMNVESSPMKRIDIMPGLLEGDWNDMFILTAIQPCLIR